MTAEVAREDLPSWLQPLAEAVSSIRAEDLSSVIVPASGGRASAVLLLVGQAEAGPDIVILRRGTTLRQHPGQPAFPGGTIDPGDGGPVQAALREAREEIGLDPAGVEVLGVLPPLFLPPSGFLVTPVLAFWRTESAIRVMDPIEVASVHRVPIAELADPANRVRVRHSNGTHGPAFDVRGMLVWGFTGGVLDGLLRLAGWEQTWDTSRIVATPQLIAADAPPWPDPRDARQS